MLTGLVNGDAIMPPDTTVFRDHISLVVLSILRCGPKYGYELAQSVKMRSEGLLELREGVLYPVLHRMVADGLLTAQWGDAQKGPRRRYYMLTPKGQKVQQHQAHQWQQFAAVIDRLIGVNPCIDWNATLMTSAKA